MTVHIIVAAKQVIDPDMPLSAMRIGEDARRVVTPVLAGSGRERF